MPPSEPSSPRPWWRRAVAALGRARTPSPRVRAVLLVAAGVAVTVGLVLSVRALDLRPSDLRWWPLVVAAFVASPVTIALNAAELRLATTIVVGRSTGASEAAPMPWRTAIWTVVVATAANLLPLPAGAIVRVDAVRRAGARLGPAAVINLVAAGLWVASGIGTAALASLGQRPGVAAIGLAVAAAGTVVSVLLARRSGVEGWPRGVAQLAVVELTTALVHATRLWLVLLALGVEVSWRQAVVLGAAAPLAAAAGVFPSGLGLAEGLTALLAPLAALPAAAGLLAAGLGRVVGLLATLLAASLLGFDRVRAGVRSAAERAADTEDTPGSDGPGGRASPVSGPDATGG